MAIPTGGDTPSRYKPNPVDDRALRTDAEREAYRSLTVAIEECESLLDVSAFRALPVSTKRGVLSAESALRRAAFSLVLYAKD